jgi:hypothetical protein
MEGTPQHELSIQHAYVSASKPSRTVLVDKLIRFWFKNQSFFVPQFIYIFDCINGMKINPSKGENEIRED